MRLFANPEVSLQNPFLTRSVAPSFIRFRLLIGFLKCLKLSDRLLGQLDFTPG